MKEDSESSSSAPTLKRKRKQIVDTEPSKPSRAKTPEAEVDSSDPETIIMDSNGDTAFDAMIPGYEHDDAYIMVEHDLIEAAKQVTRHLHLEAYHKYSTAPVSDVEILRPTTKAPKTKPQVEGEINEEPDEEGKDVSTLDDLLRRRPVTAPIAATPIKRKPHAPIIRNPNSGDEVQKLDLMRDSRQINPETETDVVGEDKETTARRNTTLQRVHEDEGEDEEDDEEDLDRRPRKTLKSISHARLETTIHPPQSHASSSKIPTIHTSSHSRTSPPRTVKLPRKRALDSDWMFNSLWEQPQRPARPAAKSSKVSLATQLEETSLKLLGQKKAISLKDQFKFMES
jgi:hypothetical protein